MSRNALTHKTNTFSHSHVELLHRLPLARSLPTNKHNKHLIILHAQPGRQTRAHTCYIHHYYSVGQQQHQSVWLSSSARVCMCVCVCVCARARMCVCARTRVCASLPPYLTHLSLSLSLSPAPPPPLLLPFLCASVRPEVVIFSVVVPG